MDSAIINGSFENDVKAKGTKLAACLLTRMM